MTSEGPRYVEVAVDVPIGPDRILTYFIPTSLSLTPGQLVWVPLGSRQVSGVVFALTDYTEIEGVRPVVGLQDSTLILQTHQLALARWLSRQTQASLYECASLMLPLDFRRRLLTLVGLTLLGQEADGSDLSEASRRILTYLRSHGIVNQERLIKAPGGEATLRRLLRAGLIEREWRWQRPRAGPQYQGYLSLRVSQEEAEQWVDKLKQNARRQRALLEYLVQASGEKMLEVTQARKEFGAGVVAALERRGLVAVEWRPRIRDPLAGRAFTPESPLTLTRDQGRALGAIQAALEHSDGRRSFLLHGVTGSGKTEVYLQALARCVALGMRGIFLVPEISLTPQLVQRLGSRFPGRVALLHSGLSLGQQYDTWWRIQQGEFDVVLGSRSAIFAPQPDLGLIVMDEEHEWTYKQQDTSPRYHARDVALKLAELTGGVVVLGGATPDVATYYRALRKEHTLLNLPDRLGLGPEGTPVSAPLPPVQVVDMRQELKEGVRGIFSRPLHDALAETLERGEQALLFLNRRGSAGTVQCRDCGYVLRCRRCEAGLTYHAQGERMVCHLCGRRSRVPERCPRCWSRHIRYLGLGTQRVVQEVERTFGARVLRWDRDAVRTPGAHGELMDRLTKGDAQVLVGTQMIAKGLHLPRVTLVGVILADLGLHLPDFRAGERTFQLLCQVVGRAGRGEAGGRAIIQAYAPEHYAVQAAAHQDYQAFYEQEIAFRQTLLYPPFSRLVRLIYEHTNSMYSQRMAERLRRDFQELLEVKGLSEIDLIGPAPIHPPRVRGRYRWHVVVRVPDTAAVDLPDLLNSFSLPPGWRVDIDPVTLV